MSEAFTNLKKCVYFFTLINGLGNIISGIYGLILSHWVISFSFVVILYCLATGAFIVVILLPIYGWSRFMESTFPFMFTFLGRFGLFVFLGPLLIIASGVVGYSFGVFSVLNGLFNFVLHFVLKDYEYRKSFFRPFEKDFPDAEDFNYGTKPSPPPQNDEITVQLDVDEKAPPPPMPKLIHTTLEGPFAKPVSTIPKPPPNEPPAQKSPSVPLSNKSAATDKPDKKEDQPRSTNPFDESTEKPRASSLPPKPSNVTSTKYTNPFTPKKDSSSSSSDSPRGGKSTNPFDAPTAPPSTIKKSTFI